MNDARAQVFLEQTAGQGFRVATLHVDPAAGVIRGPGRIEQSDPKVMDVLVMLAAHAGEVVSRDQLFDTVWPGQVVTENAISRCIYQLRGHLAAAGGDEALKELIGTQRKRGYVLHAVPELEAGAADGEPVSRRRLWVGSVIGMLATVAVLVWLLNRPAEAPATGPPAIAVLPFADLSPERDQGYFADGISEELLNTLAHLPDLRVIARSSSFSFKEQNPDIATVAERLGVSHVLEGSVRMADERVRVTAQLIDASTSLHLWSETFEREFGDIFAIQDEIAGAVAAALAVNLPDRPAVPASPRPDPGAYALAMQGLFFFNRRAEGDLERARDYFIRALGTDPGFAGAWAWLAGAYFIQISLDQLPEDEGLRLMGEAARRALALDPKLPEAHFRLWAFYSFTGDGERADTHWDLAVKHGAGHPLIMASQAGRLLRRGLLEEAIEMQQRAIELDPLSRTLHNNQASFFLAAGRLSEARQSALKALELGADGPQGSSLGIVVEAHVLEGAADQALPLLGDWPAGSRRDFYTALVHDALGRHSEADAAIARLAAGGDFQAAIHLSEVYAQRGEFDTAFDWLDVARARMGAHPTRMQVARWHSSFVINSPFLARLKPDARWQVWLDGFFAAAN